MSGVSVILLCEDMQTDVFVRRFLKRRKFRDFRSLVSPHGRGSGEQWVRERYPRELQAIRQIQGACLVVVTDADVHPTEFRRAQLDAECDEKRIPRRKDDERVLVIVPRRNIETWLAYLAGDEVDEEKRYERLKREGNCAWHAKELFRMCHEKQRLREPAPPSLREACGEYRRLRRQSAFSRARRAAGGRAETT